MIILYRMSQFASIFNRNEIMEQPVPQIPWGTILLLIKKTSNHDELIWYINKVHECSWSRTMVLNQIEMKAYERSLIEPSTTTIIKSDDLTNELFKDTYVFSFIDKNEIKNEKDLKNKMVDNIIQFLSELGPGFSLVGKEYKLTTPTNKDFYIDLLMYHTKIHAYVVIEVKIGDFEPKDIGQLSFYVNAIDDLEKEEIDNETIGLLICKNADGYVAQTTLKNSLNKIGISKYKFIEELPQYLKRKLNEK